MKNNWSIQEVLGSMVLRGRTLSLAVLTLLLLIPVTGTAQTKEQPKSFALADKQLDAVERKTLASINVEALLAEDEKRRMSPQRPGPLRFAIAEDAAFDLNNSGTWRDLPDGRLWRLRMHSPGAVSHNLGITRFELPEGAKLWIYNPEGKHVEGAYTTRDRSHEGSLWTPIIEGDEIVVELFVPIGASGAVVVIGKVNKGYRTFGKEGVDKQGSCNNDVICPEGDPWRDEIRSVARYSINGTGLCTGQLVNNTAQDFTPYFLSANHCGVNSTNDATLVFFWNFESANCGDLSGGSLANTQTGATFRAASAASDFVLVELEEDPDPAFNVYFAGWDADGSTAASTVCIHHPSGDEKAISFNNNAVTSTAYLSSTVSAAANHWRVDDWEDGTTEPGSSGSGIWDAATHRIVGQLHGGNASCSSVTDDWFGKFSTSWTGGGTNSTRLSNWLDPGNTGILELDGDPHLTTLDGIHFDFQGAGEYVALRDNDLAEIQVRMAPIATSFNPGPSAHHGLSTCVSLNTAVAVRMGKHRITYQPNLSGVPDPSGLQLRVDGKLTTLGAAGLYLGGGRIAKTVAEGGIAITFPSKYVLTVTPGWWGSQSKWYLNVDVIRTAASGVVGASPAADKGGVGGLCGDIPGKSWLPRLPDGFDMGPMPVAMHDRYVDLYEKFGAAWRVTAATSLFDYAPGTSTADFTLTAWPMEQPPCVLPATVQVRPLDLATAQAACASITNANRRANCVFDVQVTGEVGFAQTYILSQRIEDGATTTTVNADRDQSQRKETVEFIATVVRSADRDGAKPTGTVQFMLDGKEVGKPVNLDRSGRAVWSTSTLELGEHTIAATYIPGSEVFLASTSLQIPHTVIEPQEDAAGEDGATGNWTLWMDRGDRVGDWGLVVEAAVVERKYAPRHDELKPGLNMARLQYYVVLHEGEWKVTSRRQKVQRLSDTRCRHQSSR
ncbi:MAG: Ig-like domain repeat protein [Flavobacteriales bacterium]|nr:Ig-like domain repeat protein [Flavobacteriales bacterium]